MSGDLFAVQSWAPLFGAGTVLLAVAVSVPQFARLRSGAGAAGVSLPAVINSAISFLAWTVYAIRIGDGWLIASSAIGLPFAAAAALAAWRYGARRTGLWVPALWIAALLVTATAELSGRDVARLVVGASIGWLVVPAVVTAWRSRDVSGIAPGSWWVLSAEGALFLGYGVAQTVLAAAVYGVIALTGSGAVLARLARGSAERRAGHRRAGHRRIGHRRVGWVLTPALATVPACPQDRPGCPIPGHCQTGTAATPSPPSSVPPCPGSQPSTAWSPRTSRPAGAVR